MQALCNKKCAKGFTLVEVLITVTIVAILTAIALPAYQSHIAKARRADAKAALVGLAQAMERHNADTNSYDAAADPVGVPIIYPDQVPVRGPSKFYDLTVENITPNSYLLRATPTGAQAGDGDLIYSSTGLKQWNKDNSAAIDADENCWKRVC